MECVMIASNVRVDEGKTVTLPARAGGSKCKTVQYWVVVVGQSDTAPTYFAVQGTVQHGVDGLRFKEHTAVATMVTVDGGAMTGNLDADTSKLIGEYTRLLLTGSSPGASKWAIVNVYEIRRPF